MDRRLGRARLERRELKEGLDMEPWLRICWYERSHGIRIPAVGGGGGTTEPLPSWWLFPTHGHEQTGQATVRHIGNVSFTPAWLWDQKGGSLM